MLSLCTFSSSHVPRGNLCYHRLYCGMATRTSTVFQHRCLREGPRLVLVERSQLCKKVCPVTDHRPIRLCAGTNRVSWLQDGPQRSVDDFVVAKASKNSADQQISIQLDHPGFTTAPNIFQFLSDAWLGPRGSNISLYAQKLNIHQFRSVYFWLCRAVVGEFVAAKSGGPQHSVRNNKAPAPDFY